MPTGTRSGVVADAGGLAVAGGGSIRRERLLRVPGAFIGREDLKALAALEPRAFVDLRGEEDERRRIERWARREGVAYVHLPIGVAGGRDMMRRIVLGGGGPRGMIELYRTIVDGYGEQLATAAATIADGAPVAFGCAAGKDRTGILAALLQELLGAHDDDIVAAYRSAPPSAELLAQRLREDYDVPDRYLRLRGARALLSTQDQTLQATLAHVRREHGSVEAYLLAHGLPGDAPERLRDALVDRG